jgi:thiosulfate dehydrogenase (quinone) large subunit
MLLKARSFSNDGSLEEELIPVTSQLQAIALIFLRTLIGWHFLYEGYYKLVLPGWTRFGQPVTSWSAAGYLSAATGPLAPLFRDLAQTRAIGAIDVAVPIGLALVGLSLVCGLFTQLGCAGAMCLLTLFYLSAIPTTGAPQPGAEGTYLLVSKNLIELAAVFVVFAFRTGRIAGLDVLRSSHSPASRTRYELSQ